MRACVRVCYCVCVSTDNVATLFRASTLATMLMDQLMKLTAMNYLHSVLKDPVQRIADLKEVYTVSNKLGKRRDLFWSSQLEAPYCNSPKRNGFVYTLVQLWQCTCTLVHTLHTHPPCTEVSALVYVHGAHT